MIVKAHSYIGDYGQMVDKLVICADRELPKLQCGDFVCQEAYVDLGTTVPTAGATGLHIDGKTVTISFQPFLYRTPFRISCNADALQVTITKETIQEMTVHHADMFAPVWENGVHYQLYSPQATFPRPLVLYLHGGGASGEDNLLQLTDTLGAIKLAERVPDMYILAPQAHSGSLTMEEAFAKMCAKGDPFKVILGSDPDNDKDDRGWNREYIGRVIDVIRRMIAEGKVDHRRIYCIGGSMGGFGTIKFVSSAPDLFAACVPICPSMNGESWPILANFPDVPIYISTSYIDHQVGRHAYILRAVQQLWEKGRKDVKFVMYTPEELAAYGIGTTPNVSTPDLYAENHNSWILTMHNEYGILDWLFSHVKK